MTESTVVFLDVASLSPIEGHGKKRVLWLKNKIETEGFWTMPLKVERTKSLVMDGHHRFEVAKAMGFRRVPAELFTYDEVEVWSLRPNIEVTGEIILRNHTTGIIFPYKTAKHRFPKDVVKFRGVPLDELF
jgi:hypothetical protein